MNKNHSVRKGGGLTVNEDGLVTVKETLKIKRGPKNDEKRKGTTCSQTFFWLVWNQKRSGGVGI